MQIELPHLYAPREYQLPFWEAFDSGMRPILAENGGWAILNFTPRGKNHGYKLYEMALAIMLADIRAGLHPRWWVSKLSVDDTNVLTPEVIEDERAAGMTEDMVQQEFY